MLSNNECPNFQLRTGLVELMLLPLSLQFVSHHAPGARTLRFVRKMPLLKGLSDNALLDVASRMTEEQFEVWPPFSHLNLGIIQISCCRGTIY